MRKAEWYRVRKEEGQGQNLAGRAQLSGVEEDFRLEQDTVDDLGRR